MKFLKYFLFISFVLTLMLGVLPLSAFASDVVSYNIPFSRPQVTDGSGYAEILFERSNGNRYVRLLQWQSTPSDNMIGTEKILTNVTINTNGTVKIAFDYPEHVFYAVVSIYDSSIADVGHFNVWQDVSTGSEIDFNLDYDDDIVSFNIYGDYTHLTSDMINEYIPKFSVTYGEDTALSDVLSKLTIINNNLLQLHSDNLIAIEDIENISSQISLLYDDLMWQLDTIYNEIFSTNTWLDFISDQLNDLSDRLHQDNLDLQQKIDTVNYWLQHCRNHLNVIQSYTSKLPDIEQNTYNTWEVLLYIYQLLTDNLPENNLTSPDTSDMDGYIDAENGLLNNSDVAVDEVVKVEVNQNALQVIWLWVDQFVQSNNKVFGMLLTVLSLGLVAMVLGRKV